MDSNVDQIIPVPIVVECPPILQTDEDSMRIQTDGVSTKTKKANHSVSSHGKSTKMTKKDGGLLLKRKKPNPLPISQMVMEAIKSLKKRNGASVDAILEYMKIHHKVDAKQVKRYVTRFLQSATKKATLEQLNGADGGLFKIKKSEKIGQKLKVGQKKAKNQ